MVKGGARKECKGIFGYLFGHKYDSLRKKYASNYPMVKIQGDKNEIGIGKNENIVFIIICKRCGNVKQ